MDYQNTEQFEENALQEQEAPCTTEVFMKVPQEGKNKFAWTSLILGIIGSLGWIVPIIGLPVTVVGTVLGAVGIKNKHNRGISIAGMVVSIVFLCASIAKGIVDIIFYFKKER